MTTGMGNVDRRLRALLRAGSTDDLTDGQLLGRFAAGPGAEAESAFATLVERHGPMVLRVARGILADPHDAQDAFQATFLVLVARARGLRARDTIGPWLHQVARRTALCQRAAIARRRQLDRHVAVSEVATRPSGLDDLGRVLHEEIGRLPERYRAPVVLCDLEGRTHEQAARDLGWPVGTVKSRQARARDRLRDRLARRGVAPALLGLAPPSMLPTTLIDSTAAAAARSILPRAFATGTAAALAREVIGTMMLLHWGKLGSTVLALVVAASGAGLVAQDPGGKPAEGPKTAEAPAPSPAPGTPAEGPPTVEVRPGKLNFTLNGRGAVEPARPRQVVSEIEGVLIRIQPDGSDVRAGDVVAELDSGALRDELINQRIKVLQAEASYKQARLTREVAEFAVKEYTQGVASQDRSELQAKIATAEATIGKAKARLKRTQAVRAELDSRKQQPHLTFSPADLLTDLTVSDRLDEAEQGLKSAELDLESTRARLAQFETYTRIKATKQLGHDVEQAVGKELEMESAWKLEESKLRKLEKQIGGCVLTAPIDGRVVLGVDPTARTRPTQVEAGSTVRERQLVFSVLDPADPMRVNARVPERLVDQVREGTSVRVTRRDLPGEAFTGVVESVAGRADVATMQAEGVKVYPTMIRLDPGAAGKLHPGMGADVAIPIFELDEVLSVPIGAVVSGAGGDWVMVQTPTGAEWRKATLGRANDRDVEVKDGLRPGDRVLLKPPAPPAARPARPDAPK